MKRLKDSPNSEHGALTEMVRATEPFVLPDTARARMRAKLLDPSRPVAAPGDWVRPAVAFVAAVGLAAAVIALVGYQLKTRHQQQLIPAPLVTPMPQRAPIAPAPIQIAEAHAPATTANATTANATTANATTANATTANATTAPSAETTPATNGHHLASRPRMLTPPAPIVETAPDTHAMSHEAAMVAAAAKVLRSDHDAKRAQVLLENYLRDYPRGVLREEALALAIEAATVYDRSEATRLGAEYLKHYPRGRFTKAAERAILH